VRAALACSMVTLAVLGTAACSIGPEQPEAEPSRSSSATAPPAPATTTGSTPTGTPAASASATRSPAVPLSHWEIGSVVLPVRPDGYGEARPTPRQLRVRRMPTVDVLPPPDTDRFRATVGPVTRKVRKAMGTTWRPGCPVGLRDLRYVTVTFRGFDRLAHTGELVVNAHHAKPLTRVFRRLYEADFPIEQMTLPTTVEPDPTPNGDGNGTAAFACRPTTGETSWSAHAFGLALDLNPFQNPYRSGDLLLPELARSYLNRGWRRPGMIHPDGVVVRAFADIGWSWGGDFRTLEDYHHFSATGR
jgi:hypothetical protein